MGAKVFSHPQTQHDPLRLLAQVRGSRSTQSDGDRHQIGLDFPDPEEVTGSNPVGPQFSNVCLAVRPKNEPNGESAEHQAQRSAPETPLNPPSRSPGHVTWYFGARHVLLPAGRSMVVSTDQNDLGGEACLTS
jgi:hypothetical protein